MCVSANCNLNNDIVQAIEGAQQNETSSVASDILLQLSDNYKIARDEQIPICQDTGMAVFFVTFGQDVQMEGGSITDAINEGVRKGYAEGFLRKSVVADPIERVNTNDNTPAVIHYDIIEGDGLTINFAPKGFGSENMSAVKMLKPSDGIEGIKDFIIQTVKNAGPNPCPPIIVGVGIGGTMEKAALMSKWALLRSIDQCSDINYVCKLEKEMLVKINELNIGPAGLGGKTTALGVNIEVYPTHIAGLPVAVNINCHATRHATAEF
jgi:fumarate hydratase subunit alpha